MYTHIRVDPETDANQTTASGNSLPSEININVHSHGHMGREYRVCERVRSGKMAFSESPVLCNITE